ncbi:MAG: glucose-1-phosphate adenylyltransferase subunit GlgD [Candidatus Eisenbacteria bacterium]|nr:glucose-1-phosphate adenylyltransferase subunit GlgD [Candidatus Eisenbacteria bacterium]
MRRVMALVLAGGSTRDLSVLTEMRATSSLPFGGKYRVIDFTLSNLCNSQIYQLGLLTQHAPLSLHAHVGIGKPWDLDRRDGGVMILQPYQRQSDTRWYLGTADAVRQNLDVLRHARARWVLILPGDLVYKMDYSWLLDSHIERNAPVTLAVGAIDAGESHRFGICRVDADQRITHFHEKPIEAMDGPGYMGIACFNADVLQKELLEHPEANNLVTEIIEPMVARGDRVDAYRYEGYWEDVGTVDTYYRASMDLLNDTPRLNLYDPEWVVYTRSEELPPARLGAEATVERSLLANGCNVEGTVENSILFPGVRIEAGATVRHSIVMNGASIAAGATLSHVIVDKDVRIGANVLIGHGETAPHKDLPALFSGGLSIIGRDAVIPDGALIGRHCVVEPGVRAVDFNGSPVESGARVRRGGEVG